MVHLTTLKKYLFYSFLFSLSKEKFFSVLCAYRKFNYHPVKMLGYFRDWCLWIILTVVTFCFGFFYAPLTFHKAAAQVHLHKTCPTDTQSTWHKDICLYWMANSRVNSPFNSEQTIRLCYCTTFIVIKSIKFH